MGRNKLKFLRVVSGVLALAATQQYFLLSEVASRILPALCQLTTDPEKNVRDSVFRTIKGFLGKLEKVSEDPSLRESMGEFFLLRNFPRKNNKRLKKLLLLIRSKIFNR